MEIPKDDIKKLKEDGDIMVFTKDSTVYSFKESSYYISNDSLTGVGSVKFNYVTQLKQFCIECL